jgi:hypothetical protein
MSTWWWLPLTAFLQILLNYQPIMEGYFFENKLCGSI